MLDLPLERMQRWMQGVVVHPGSIDEAVQAGAEVPAERLGEAILPSSTLTPAERLEIYQVSYVLRMEEALAHDYEALKHFMGDEAFGDLVVRYVQVHPSRSHTLNRLGDHFPDFVRTAEGVQRRDFCYDLARLEQAVSQVFDAEETPALSEAQIAAVPPEAWDRARFAPIAAFRLLAFRYPVDAYLQSVQEDDHEHPKARLKDEWVAVYRRSHSMQRLGLSRAAHDLLRDLVGGMPLGAAITKAVREGGRRAPREEELFRWFRDWVSGGLFRSVTT